MFGDGAWREHAVSKSAVHVRALTYCDIHMISVERLREVLEFYKAFSQTFARNLVLTCDLSKRTVFYKASERRMERVFNEVQKYEQPFTPAQVSETNRYKYICSVSIYHCMKVVEAKAIYRVTGKECNLEHLSMYLVK